MDYNALKVPELKGLLKERGIPSTGLTRKQQIIEALESHDANNEGENPAEDPASGVNDVETVSEAAGEAGGGEVAAAAAANEAEGNEASAAEEVAQAQASDDKHEMSRYAENASQSDEAHTQHSAPDAPSTQPTVLESNQPVSKEPSALATPRQPSPMEESSSSDRKRKRRSPTPPIDQETVNKKLKAAEEDIVTLPEDRKLVESASDPSGGAAESEQPSVLAGEAMDTDQAQVSERIDSDTANAPQTDGTADRPDPRDDSADAVPSVHPPTRAIYIANLVRPIQAGQLSDHLTELAAASDNRERETLANLHLGSIRTHAFAVFHSVTAASQARHGLHGRIWPDEPARKELWVDYVPEDRVQDWIAHETDGGGKRDTRRWEVVYDETDDGATARHQEVLTTPGMPERRPSNISTSGQGLGMPNAPLGPRSSRPSVPSILPPAKQATPNPTSSASFVVLDERFPSTSAKPKLYYLPVSKDIADRRLDELERQTSREWGVRGTEMAGSGGVRRYTFEDGDRLVDGGPHYDDFSGPRRGGGRGGRGGFRGRR